MKRYRFYCGLRDPRGNDVAILHYTQQVTVRGFTVFETTGYWEGCREPSIVIEIICEPFEIDAEKLARLLRDAGNQDAVLWTEEPVNAHLVPR